MIRHFNHLLITETVKDEIKASIRMLGFDPDDENIRRLIKQIKIKIDVTGGLGTAPYDLLESEGYNVVAVNSSEKAHKQELYKNKRSELWFDVRDRFRDKNIDVSRLHPDILRDLKKELGAPEYKVIGGKKVAEEKSETKKRLDYSPDLADGFNLSYYEGVKIDYGFATGGSYASYFPSVQR